MYVSTTGGGDGEESSPATLAYALQYVADGGEIQVNAIKDILGKLNLDIPGSKSDSDRNRNSHTYSGSRTKRV